MTPPTNASPHDALTLADGTPASPQGDRPRRPTRGRLAALGLQALSFFGEPTGEPSVIGWMPAAAIYFRDPDGHMLEYLAMLEGPALPELGIVPWSERGE